MLSLPVASAHADVPSSWTTLGGGSGRAGLALFGGGQGSGSLLWSRGTDGADVQSGVVVTTPGFGRSHPRVAYGTDDGRLHLRDLYDGATVGPEGGILLRDNVASTDTFRGYRDGLVTPVEAPGPSGEYGQLYVVYNDDDQADVTDTTTDPASATDDIAIAQIDIQTGRVIHDVPIPGTDKYTVSSAPLLVGPDKTGVSQLIVSLVNWEPYADDYKLDDSRRNGSPIIARVPILNAGLLDAKLDTANSETSGVRSLNPLASPTLVGLDDRSAEKPLDPVLYAAAPSADPAGSFQLLQADSLGTTITSPRLDQAAADTHPFYAQTVTVPPGDDGLAPGTIGAKLTRAPALYVATYDVVANTTTVHRLVASVAGDQLVEAARSKAYPGRPAPQLALSRAASGPGTPSGRVVLATERDLVTLKGADLSLVWRLVPKGDNTLSREGKGFRIAAPTIAGARVYVVNDRGTPAAYDLDDGKPVDGAIPDAGAVTRTAKHALTSPAMGGGVTIIATDQGIAAISTPCANHVAGLNVNEQLPGTTAGDDISGNGGNDSIVLDGGDDCADGGDGDDYLDGGAGDDDLEGGAGIDTVLGQDGNDKLGGGDGRDTLLGADGNDTANGGGGDDLVKGGQGDDGIDVGPGADTANGGDGNDTIDGGDNNDTLKGNAGDDVLRGGAGRDTLEGGAGNDTLDAGRNGGRAIGGAGDDTITTANGKVDTVHCGAGIDTVTADRGDVLSGCERVSLPPKKKRKRKKKS